MPPNPLSVALMETKKWDFGEIKKSCVSNGFLETRIGGGGLEAMRTRPGHWVLSGESSGKRRRLLKKNLSPKRNLRQRVT